MQIFLTTLLTLFQTSNILLCSIRVGVSGCWRLHSRLNELLFWSSVVDLCTGLGSHHHLLLERLCTSYGRKNLSWLHHLTELRLVLGYARRRLHHLNLLLRHLHLLQLKRGIFLFLYCHKLTVIVFLIRFARGSNKCSFSLLTLLSKCCCFGFNFLPHLFSNLFCFGSLPLLFFSKCFFFSFLLFLITIFQNSSATLFTITVNQATDQDSEANCSDYARHYNIYVVVKIFFLFFARSFALCYFIFYAYIRLPKTSIT